MQINLWELHQKVLSDSKWNIPYPMTAVFWCFHPSAIKELIHSNCFRCTALSQVKHTQSHTSKCAVEVSLNYV